MASPHLKMTTAEENSQEQETTVSITSSNFHSNPDTKPNRSSWLGIRKWAFRTVYGILLIAGLVWLAGAILPEVSSPSETTATFVVSKRKLVDTVVESGALESQSRIDGICRLHGWQNKITFIVEEGTTVEKGDVVVRFDSSSIETEIAAQKVKVNNEQAAVDEAREQIAVQENKNESDIAAAKLEKSLAELDLKKYKEGEYKAELSELDRSIAESKAALEQRRDELKNMRILVKKGYREPERLVQMEQAVKSAVFQVERDEQKKEVLTKFTYQRQITELESKAEEAGRKLMRAEATARAELTKAKLKLAAAEERLEIETKELKEEEDQLEKAEIKAPYRGTVAYANHRWMDPEYRIRPGGNVHRRQTVFHLPDMTRMQVLLEVHESLINKLKVGQKAIIQVAPFPDHKFFGRIKKIADLARSDRDSEEKAYTAIVTIDDFPDDVKLKPGMSAETEIHVRTLDDVAVVPVQAVTQIAGDEFAYVKQGSKFKRTKIDVSDGNESFLVLNSGLEVGDEIAMDAYQRGLADIENEGLNSAGDNRNNFDGIADDPESTADVKDEAGQESTSQTEVPGQSTDASEKTGVENRPMAEIGKTSDESNVLVDK